MNIRAVPPLTAHLYADSPPMTDITGTAYRKISYRLIPLLFVCYITAYLDRVNVGFAKLQMQAALNFSDTVYGLGAGIFFLGYFFLEIPSNVILHRVGARRWIARIMVTWGLLSMATVFVRSPFTFYLLRFLLGAAEAGFFPGVILYLTYWYPAARRGKAMSLFLAAIPVAGMLGGPLSGWILRGMAGTAGVHGWQWLFILQGLPTVILWLIVWRCLEDRVEAVSWLSAREREAVAQEIALDAQGRFDDGALKVLARPQVWLLALVYFSFLAGVYGISFWLPTIIEASGVRDSLDIGLLSAVPWVFGVLAMVFAAHSADRRLEHRRHCAVAALAGAAGLVISVAFHDHVVAALAGLTIATMGILATLPVFWSMPTALLGGSAAAAGIALINSFGNLAGFCAPIMVSHLMALTHSTNAGVQVLAVVLVAGAVLVLRVRRPG